MKTNLNRIKLEIEQVQDPFMKLILAELIEVIGEQQEKISTLSSKIVELSNVPAVAVSKENAERELREHLRWLKSLTTTASDPYSDYLKGGRR